jgi:hypothetical protein
MDVRWKFVAGIFLMSAKEGISDEQKKGHVVRGESLE